MSRITGFRSTSKPKRAGSPTAGVRLKTGTLKWFSSPGPIEAVTTAAPITVSGGQLLISPPEGISAKSVALQRGVTIALPSCPGGSLKRRLRGSAGGFRVSALSRLKATSAVSW